jgi:putative SOS response-associated peptidase YedK
MCGRYSIASPAKLVQETFELEEPPELDARWNVAPTQPAPVVRLVGGERRLAALRWGLVPAGSEGLGAGPLLIKPNGEPEASSDVGEQAAGRRRLLIKPNGEPQASSDVGEQAAGRRRLLINARSETAATLPAFRDSFRRRRCLVPADGFYEWTAGPGPRGKRQPFHIRRPDRRPFAMAGLWDRWTGADGEAIESFAVLTCKPTSLVAGLHDRMPVILPAGAWEAWLGDSSKGLLRDLLVPYPEELEAVAVDTFVNRADHEGPECLQAPRPVTPEPPAPSQRSLF